MIDSSGIIYHKEWIAEKGKDMMFIVGGFVGFIIGLMIGEYQENKELQIKIEKEISCNSDL